MGIYRPKPIESEFFYELWKYNGQAYRLGSDTVPAWLRRFPHVFASGDSAGCMETWDGILFENVVGGIDVIREDPQDYSKGIRFNKDHYVVTSGNLFVALGPLKGDDHWLKQMPERLRSVNYLQISSSGTV